MTFFYYNHIYTPPAGLNIPCVCRARARYQPGLPKMRQRRIRLPFWLIDAPTLPTGMQMRIPPEPEWHQRAPLELYLYRPNTCFEELHPVEAERANVFVLFSGGEFAGLEELFLPGETYLRLYDTDSRICERITEIARRGMLEGDSAFWDVQLLLYEILADFRRTVRTDEPHLLAYPGEINRDDDLVYRVDQLLLARLSQSYSRAELAAEFGCSVSSLSHRYRQRTGRSIMQRRMELRLGQAASLLDTGLPLEQIAALTGFSSGFHLSRAFKQFYGVSPRAKKLKSQ